MNTLREFVEYKLTHCDKTAEANGYPLTMENGKKNKRMKQLQIYGNTVQDGTPTPDNPIEVQSVGEIVTDENDINYGKYKIPIAQRGIHIVNPKTFVGSALSYNAEDDTYTMKYGSSRFSNACMQASTIPVGSKIYIDVKWIDDNLNKKQFGVMLVYKDGTRAYSAIQKTYCLNFTIAKPLDYISLYFNNSDEVQGCWVKFKDLIVGYQDEFTEYEPYIEPTTTNIFLNEPLRRLGDYADYIDFKNNQVVRKCVKKYLKDCAWNSNIGEYGGNYSFTAIDRTIIPSYYNQTGLGNSELGKSNVFPVYASGNQEKYSFAILMSGWISNVQVMIPPEYLSEKSLNAFKDWLEIHSSYMVRVLVEPVIEPLNADLLKLNAKTTILEVDTSLSPSNIYGKYIKK